ncbi:MAG: DUF4412 domain-containing protein [Bacteroidetes bacterium]|nr:DUF4412 domain-containing protein [Bacteroidota bacterium]
MKNTLFTVFACLFINLFTTAQSKITEGKVVYSVTLPEAKKGDENALAMAMGKEQVIYFKGDRSRIETKTSMGDVVVLNNRADGSMYTLMNLMGKKIAMKMEEGDMEAVKASLHPEDNDKAKEPEVKLTSETKKIADYKCKKALVTYPSENGEKVQGEVWYTDQIGFSGPREFKIKGIEGFPMEFSYNARGISVKMTCTSVESVPVKDDKFQIPDDYTIKTMMEMMSDGMGFR